MNNYFLPKVLLIEDDQDDVEFFKYALAQASPKTKLHVEQSCLDGINHLIENINVRPDAIFLDLRMYLLDGDECIKLIKKNDDLKDIPIVAVSTSITPDLLEKLYNLGITYFITKPTTLEKLQQALKKVATTPNLFNLSTRESFHMQDFD